MELPLGEGALVGSIGGGIKQHEAHEDNLWVGREVSRHGAKGHGGRFLHRIAVHARGDRGKRDGEDWEVPFELGAKYESRGLKPGDAFIAAYTEWTGAEYLVTENRDFLSLTALPFKIARAEAFLKKPF